MWRFNSFSSMCGCASRGSTLIVAASGTGALMSRRALSREAGTRTQARSQPAGARSGLTRGSHSRAHDLDRRRDSSPELESGGALGDQDLEPVDDTRSRGIGCARGRRPWIRQVDESLPGAKLEEDLVALGGGVDDEVGVRRVWRPGSLA